MSVAVKTTEKRFTVTIPRLKDTCFVIGNVIMNLEEKIRGKNKMCNKRNSVLWEGKRVDRCMRNGLNRFLNYGIKTLACCCGHSVYPETIVIQTEKREVREFNSNIKIPRKKKFYKKDSKGFYYIPEVMVKNKND